MFQPAGVDDKADLQPPPSDLRHLGRGSSHPKLRLRSKNRHHTLNIRNKTYPNYRDLIGIYVALYIYTLYKDSKVQLWGFKFYLFLLEMISY